MTLSTGIPSQGWKGIQHLPHRRVCYKKCGISSQRGDENMTCRHLWHTCTDLCRSYVWPKRSITVTWSELNISRTSFDGHTWTNRAYTTQAGSVTFAGALHKALLNRVVHLDPPDEMWNAPSSLSLRKGNLSRAVRCRRGAESYATGDSFGDKAKRTADVL
ncbi:hypothetical protein BJV78DRAFT_1356059 [Lactifluus subvellereus]|nr:hypothetical protein BJV78DRAFT_1356059 [Lactifluus subvellereus]